MAINGGWWVPLVVPGFSAEGKNLTIGLIRIQVVSMVLNAGIVTPWAAQHARRQFVWVELSGVTGLELQIVPDRRGGEARASLSELRLA